jgi:hypothetical protein
MGKAAVKMARKKRTASVLRRMHRTLGAGAAAFIIFMVLSGLVINHSNSLGLDQRHVSQSFLLEWYGFGKPSHIDSYPVGKDWLSFAGSQLYLNEIPVSSVSNGVGAVFNGEILIAAANDELLLLDSTGQLIERQAWGPPGAEPIEAIGLLADGTVVLGTQHQLWQSDADLIRWKQADDNFISPGWSRPENTPAALMPTIMSQYRGDGLSLERLLLDLNSGRIFGPIGLFVYDLLALTLGFLTLSGLVLWLRGRRNGKQNPKSRSYE